MSKTYTDHLYDSFRDTAKMLLSLIKMIEKEDALKKNHRAYLPVREQIAKTGRQYEAELNKIMNEIMNEMKEHEEQAAESDHKDDLMALHGDFFLASYDFLMTLYAQIESLYYAVKIFREQHAEKPIRENYDPLKDLEEIIFEIKDKWDHTIVTDWFSNKGDVTNAG